MFGQMLSQLHSGLAVTSHAVLQALSAGDAACAQHASQPAAYHGHPQHQLLLPLFQSRGSPHVAYIHPYTTHEYHEDCMVMQGGMRAVTS